MARQRCAPEEYLFTNVVAPIVSCYFEMLLRHALQFECNAQNVLLGFSPDGTIEEVVFRDFESVDKDLSLADALQLSVTFNVQPFKCVHQGLYNYAIKHSFMYDFKLGEYIISPLTATLATTATQAALRQEVRDLGRRYVEQLPDGFFPEDGQWYSYANVVVDKTKKRPYVPHPKPVYR